MSLSDSARSNLTTTNEAGNSASAGEPIFWRVEGSLLDLTAVRPVGFFSWNAQTFRTLDAARHYGRSGNRAAVSLPPTAFATRLLHTVLRRESRDRIELLGEEFFQYFLKPRLKSARRGETEETIASGGDIVLVSQGLDHIMRPLANDLGVRWILCNRLDFRDGLATGRLLDPVIPPRGPLAKFGESTGRAESRRKCSANWA